MKMSNALYEELKADIITLAKFHVSLGYTKRYSQSDMWKLFHSVSFDRMYDDSHPAFVNGRHRILPFWSRNGEPIAMRGNDHWLNRFYDEEDLNDTHIQSALNKIYKEISVLNT